ncbi:sensor domain-containing protein [Kineobactrum salinum]|uniref:cyclic-guanylate-specific phosphodiesterase n=1 Tax=Kineobactrum salinum TaxID=2708301 RepID=A0A6C0TYD7_9GAMM|nr:EAL domain-containing protein [Kineobactrum salinum]QIB64658.1 EAL domain-containing protein [Kineobactrum salinum]
MNSQQTRAAATRLTCIYLIVGAAWILLSDRALLLLIPDATVADISDYQTLKGWLFIVLTGLLLSILLRRTLTEHARIQQELDRAEYQHLQRLSLLEVGVYETDNEGRLHFANQTATVQGGIAAQGQLREQAFEQVATSHQARVQAAWAAALRQREVFLEQYPVQRAGESGSRWLIDSAYPRYTDTVFNGHVGTITDVTRLREAQEFGRAMEHRLQLTLEASPTITYTLAIDGEDVRISWISDNVERILGHRAASVLQPGWWQGQVHPADLNQLSAMLQRHRNNPDAEASVLFRMRDGDGNFRWIRSVSRRFDAISDDQDELTVVGCWTDVTEATREQELRDLYAAVFSELSEGILIVDQDDAIVSANHAFSRISGVAAAQLPGLGIAALDAAGKPDHSGFRDVMDMLDEHAHWHGEILFNNHEGRQIPLAVTASIVHSASIGTHKRVLICRDISAEKRFREDLLHLAHYDSLTNLPNRLLLTSRLEHAIERARRKDQQLAVLFLDLDEFKAFNDSYGHVAGDEVLVEAARRLQLNLRKSDTLARLGGDEFICLIEDLDSADAAATKAEEFIASLAVRHTLGNGRDCFIGCCIGISLFPDNGESCDDLLQSADTAMYRAKSMGSGHYCFATTDLGISAVQRMDTISKLRRGIEQQELLLHYQPSCVTASAEIVAAEALVRWQRPDGGLVVPARFIPLAESSGLINALGAWVIDEVGRQLRQWLDTGQPVVCIHINISARQFQDQDLVALLADMLQRYRLSPMQIGLEITESALMQQPHQVVQILERLHAMGFSIALDDFGTGFCSFTYLTQMPIDCLKIDKVFVDKIGRSEKDSQIVRAMLELASTLGLEAIAEGVETGLQQQFLAINGCDFIQGYLLSRPLPAEQFIELLLAQRDRPSPPLAP